MSETFDPELVTRWYATLADGSRVVMVIYEFEYDHLLAAFREAQLEIQKLSNRCDELLATGNALAAELDKARRER